MGTIMLQGQFGNSHQKLYNFVCSLDYVQTRMFGKMLGKFLVNLITIQSHNETYYRITVNDKTLFMGCC